MGRVKAVNTVAVLHLIVNKGVIAFGGGPFLILWDCHCRMFSIPDPARWIPVVVRTHFQALPGRSAAVLVEIHRYRSWMRSETPC